MRVFCREKPRGVSSAAPADVEENQVQGPRGGPRDEVQVRSVGCKGREMLGDVTEGGEGGGCDRGWGRGGGGKEGREVLGEGREVKEGSERQQGGREGCKWRGPEAYQKPIPKL